MGRVMPTYLVFLRWTDQGIKQIKGSPGRHEAGKRALEAAGARVKAFYMVMGQYDAVAIWEAPDDETVAKLALSVESKGDVRFEILRAFTEEEYRKLITALP